MQCYAEVFRFMGVGMKHSVERDERTLIIISGDLVKICLE